MYVTAPWFQSGVWRDHVPFVATQFVFRVANRARHSLAPRHPAATSQGNLGSRRASRRCNVQGPRLSGTTQPMQAGGGPPRRIPGPVGKKQPQASRHRRDLAGCDCLSRMASLQSPRGISGGDLADTWHTVHSTKHTGKRTRFGLLSFPMQDCGKARHSSKQKSRHENGSKKERQVLKLFKKRKL